jgi:hypothetical protein
MSFIASLSLQHTHTSSNALFFSEILICYSDYYVYMYLQAFVTRELGSDFDLALYNDLITQVIGSGKHSSYFG